MLKLVLRLICAAPMAIALLTTPAAAITFVDFTSNGSNGIRLVEAGGTSTLSRWPTGLGEFSYREWKQGEMAPALLQDLSGDVNFNLVKGPGDSYYTGTLFFRYGGGRYPEYGLNVGDVIFTANITNGVLDGDTFTASWNLPPGGTDIYSHLLSDANHFSGPILLTMTLPSATPTGNFVSPFTGAFTSGIPEPTTWMLLIAGFGLTGAVLRRRLAQALVPAASVRS